MRNLIIAVLLLSGLWFAPTGCGEAIDVDKMLQETDIRNEIFTNITGDPEMMRQFMDHVRADRGSMMMMNNDLPGMMRDNPEMMHGMMQHMTSDGEMMTHMLQMMQQQGTINEECLQSITQMMESKGMHSGEHMGDHMGGQ